MSSSFWSVAPLLLCDWPMPIHNFIGRDHQTLAPVPARALSTIEEYTIMDSRSSAHYVSFSPRDEYRHEPGAPLIGSADDDDGDFTDDDGDTDDDDFRDDDFTDKW